MVNNNAQISISSNHTASLERRGKPRIQCSYPALVRVHNETGEKIETQAVLANMSASGMYLNIDQHFQEGESLFIVVRLSSTSAKTSAAPQIAAQGKIVRTETQDDGAYGIAVNLQNHRFL